MRPVGARQELVCTWGPGVGAGVVGTAGGGEAGACARGVRDLGLGGG